MKGKSNIKNNKSNAVYSDFKSNFKKDFMNSLITSSKMLRVRFGFLKSLMIGLFLSTLFTYGLFQYNPVKSYVKQDAQLLTVEFVKVFDKDQIPYYKEIGFQDAQIKFAEENQRYCSLLGDEACNQKIESANIDTYKWFMSEAYKGKNRATLLNFLTFTFIFTVFYWRGIAGVLTFGIFKRW